MNKIERENERKEQVLKQEVAPVQQNITRQVVIDTIRESVREEVERIARETKN